MISKYHRIALFLLSALSLLATSCYSRPFGGIAIPGMTSVVPREAKDDYAIQEQLKALHVVNPSPYEIKAGDTLQLSVYNQPTLSSNILVAPDGTVSLPLIGLVKLAGMNLEDATDLIEQKLSKYLKSPLVTLSPVSVSGYYFTIAGRVVRPGNYTVSIGQTHLLDAISLSGGFQTGSFHGDTVELADLDNAYVKRDGKRLPVDFKKVVYEGDDLHNIPLLNGDYIYVPSTMSGYIIFLGEVGSNTYVGFTEGMTLLQGLSYVNGLKTGTYSRYVRVIRGGMENTVVYTVDVDKILNGKMKDFTLCANDIIYVPQNNITIWNNIIKDILPTIQLINLLAGPFGSTIFGYFGFSTGTN
ncbi:MAG: polysaccharide biosynthesis/export family protein [Lentisphaeria bacterium]|nr:polysaccharide biosynthesis/export family protein [Lentisphaeria bacterium]